MRILDDETDKKLDKITIYLRNSEAIELRDSLTELLENPNNHHSHVPSDDYSKEVTVCIYENQDIESFDSRSRKLILDDQ